MMKVCISYDTGGNRRGGHFTHYSFTGLPGVEIAALADSNPEAEKSFRLTGAKRLYSSFTILPPLAWSPSSNARPLGAFTQGRL